jgi:hypothetical protein
MWCRHEEHTAAVALVERLLGLVDAGAEPERVVGVLLDEKIRRVEVMAAAARDAALVERLEKRRWH